MEAEGYITEYTAIPDFAKIGYELMAITLLGYKPVSEEELGRAIKVSQEILERSYEECILVSTGACIHDPARMMSCSSLYAYKHR